MTDPPMYNVASAVFCRSLAIVWSLPLPGCGLVYRLVRSVADTMRLQEDLEALENGRSLQVLALIRNIFHFLFSLVH